MLNSRIQALFLKWAYYGACEAELLKFSEYELRPELLEALNDIGFTEATPIQESVMPHILVGKDVSGLAQTGTGKTGAFCIPLIDRILRYREGETGERVPGHWKKNSFVLVLVPTRELATQVEETVVKLGKKHGIRSVVISGGTSYEPQKKALKEGVEFVVGTPGRVLDLYKSHLLDLRGVGAIVFDEADRMFDMGFKDDMKFILRRVPRNRQFLLFSATLNFDVTNTAYQFGSEPIEFNLSRDQITAEGIDHEIHHIGQEDKPKYLLSIMKKYQPQQCIVFSNFKSNVGRVARFLKDNGFEATEISSLLSQRQRNHVIEAFKTGQKQILVATDVAARGLDIKGVDLVVNFELPDDCEGYVHRIGRTGRAGANGKAIGLVSDRDVDALGRIEEYLKEKVTIGWMEDSDIIQDFKAFPRSGDFSEGNSFRRQRFEKQKSDGSKRRPERGQQRRPRRPHKGDSRKRSAAQGENSHGQIAGERNGEARSSHRDRATGRHGGIDFGDNGDRQRKGRSHHKRGSQKQRSFDGGKPKRRKLNKTNRIYRKNQNKQDKTLGGTIKRIFSKLFG